MPFIALSIICGAVIILVIALVRADQDINSEVTEIEAEFLWKKLKGERKPLIIDLRSQQEYKAGHISGAELKRVEDLPEWAEGIPREREIVLICSNGKKSKKIARILEKEGFEFVEYLAGGMDAWPFERETE